MTDDPNGYRLIQLTRGHFARVDDSDYEALQRWTWQVLETTAGFLYAVRKTRTRFPFRRARTIYMHRLLLGVENPSVRVDHIDGDGLNNRRSNLRLATPHQNAGNTRPRSGGTSRFKGVHWFFPTRKWQARITIRGVRKSLGYFRSEEDAARAYDAAALRYFGEFAHTNAHAFPGEL